MTPALSPLQAIIVLLLALLAMIALWWAEKERNKKP